MLYFNLEMINKANILVVSGLALLPLEEKQVNSLRSPQLKGKIKLDAGRKIFFDIIF